MSICFFAWHNGGMATSNSSAPSEDNKERERGGASALVHDSGCCSEPALCCPAIGDPALDEDAAQDMVEVLKALADPVRLRLINLIAQQSEVCACDLPELLGRSQPTISHHLSVLVGAGLLHREKRGKWAWFKLRDEQLMALAEAITPISRSCC